MGLNMGSVLAKAKAAISPGGSAHKRWMDTVDKAFVGKIKIAGGGSLHTPQEAAEKFIEVLQKNIQGSGMSAGAVAAISGLAATAPTKLKDGTYQVGVYFSSNLSRPSLDEKKYGGITDLAELFDAGVDHVMNPVYGMWNGSWVKSRTTITGTHFMDSAAAEFMGAYASEYGVLSLTIDRSF